MFPTTETATMPHPGCRSGLLRGGSAEDAGLCGACGERWIPSGDGQHRLHAVPGQRGRYFPEWRKSDPVLIF